MKGCLFLLGLLFYAALGVDGALQDSTSGSGSDEGSGGKRPDQRKGNKGRIINGEFATPFSWPWQVLLEKNGEHNCGGSLIAPQWVLTAAHCVVREKDTRKYEAIVGVHVLGKPSLYSSRHRIAKIIHHRYDGRTQRNDIALLKLETPVSYNTAVEKIRLPPSNTEPPPGWMCIVTGWGSVYAGSPSAVALQQAEIPLVDGEECKRVNGHIHPISTEQMLCAGGNGKGACHGDSGGPLVCQESGTWTLRGVVSWGDERCRTGRYSVFAKVQYFKPWILQNIEANGGPGTTNTEV